MPVWLVWMKWPRRFDLVALTVGAAVPDLFEPFGILGVLGSASDLVRNWTHSILGAFTLDAILGLAATTLVVRPALAWAARARPSGLWTRFAGQEFLRPRSWPVVVLSVWIGTLSHIFLDVPFHAMLRLFYPAPGILLYAPGLDFWAHLAADLVLGPAFAYLVYVYWWLPSRRTRGTTARIEID